MEDRDRQTQNQRDRDDESRQRQSNQDRMEANPQQRNDEADRTDRNERTTPDNSRNRDREGGDQLNASERDTSQENVQRQEQGEPRQRHGDALMEGSESRQDTDSSERSGFESSGRIERESDTNVARDRNEDDLEARQ